jgi:diacylglycerol kinase family enzyme
VTVLLNEAGGTPVTEAAIAARFLAARIDAQIVVLSRGRDPAEAARAASAHATVVVAAGGDGTVGAVAAGLAGTSTVLGVLPLGTLNHFAKDLRMPLDLEGAVATIAGGRIASIDVGRVNDRVFVNNSSIGVYPSVVRVREELRRAGHRKWPAMALATVRVLRHYHGVLVRITADGRQAVWRTPFVFVGNNQYTLEGTHLGGRTTLDAARLFAYLAPRVRARELPMLFVRAVLRRASTSEAFEIVSAPELWVDPLRARRVRVALDGEITTMTAPLHYRTWPGALRVLLPPT